MPVYAKRGTLVRMLYLAVASVWYLLSAGKWWRRDAAVVLCYHGILAEQKERFYQQMAKISGWSTSDAVTSDQSRGLGRHRTRVYITFDDAFENLLENALPILDDFNMPAMVFAVPGNLGQTPKWDIGSSHPEYVERVMTAEQLKQVSSERIRIGSHTQTHPDLSRLSARKMRWELTESRTHLETLVDCPIVDLALPHGAYNATVLQTAREAGYERIYTLEPRLRKLGDEGDDVIGRFSMSPDVWPIEFYLTCKGAYVWLHVFRKGLRIFRALLLKVS